jgi:hypothetical protein
MFLTSLSIYRTVRFTRVILGSSNSVSFRFMQFTFEDDSWYPLGGGGPPPPGDTNFCHTETRGGGAGCSKGKKKIKLKKAKNVIIRQNYRHKEITVSGYSTGKILFLGGLGGWTYKWKYKAIWDSLVVTCGRTPPCPWESRSWTRGSRRWYRCRGSPHLLNTGFDRTFNTSRTYELIIKQKLNLHN